MVSLRALVRIARPAASSLLTQLLFWAGLNLILSLTVPGIDNAGHLGGLAMGLVLKLLSEALQGESPAADAISTRTMPRTASRS